MLETYFVMLSKFNFDRAREQCVSWQQVPSQEDHLTRSHLSVAIDNRDRIPSLLFSMVQLTRTGIGNLIPGLPCMKPGNEARPGIGTAYIVSDFIK